MDTTYRLQIRRNTYRGRDGFTVSGQARGTFPVRIFAETREAAEHIREMVRRDLDFELVDFEGHDAGLSGYCTRCMAKVA